MEYINASSQIVNIKSRIIEQKYFASGIRGINSYY